jgi:DNA-binding MarR family transcriptional regulator
MSGIAISTIEPSIVASSTPSVVFERATHLYLAGSTGNLFSLPVYNLGMSGPTPQVVAGANELRLVLGQLVRRLRAEYSFPVAQATVLSRLDREGAQTTSALAAGERVRPQSMAQTLGELEAAGLIGRRADPADRRRVLIELTERGRERVLEERGRREGWLAAAITAELSPEEQRTLLAAVPLLRRLSGHDPARR